MALNLRGALSEARTRRRALRALLGGPGLVVALLVLIWVLLPLVPEGTQLRFGWVYRVFFTVMVAIGALLFWFIGKERIPQPRSPKAVLASLVAVWLVTVGLLVGAGVIYPQFPRPEPPQAAAGAEAAERGKALFSSPDVGCFRCHAVAGTGGTRGPDLTKVATGAAERVSGLTARDYLLEKLKAGSTYEFQVPGYAPMMPPFGQMISGEQIDDLIAYLLTLTPEGG